MISDLMAYALLAFIFVVTRLRNLLEKPNKTTEIPLGSSTKMSERIRRRWRDRRLR